MNSKNNKLIMSASSLGAGMLGLGIGILWGNYLSPYGLFIIIAGALIHIIGMYFLQLKNPGSHIKGYSKILWISAWICLLLIFALFIFIRFGNK